MSDRMATGMARLNARMKSRVSATYTYRRDNHEVDLEVTVGAVKVTPLTVLAGVMADRDITQPSPEHADHPFFFNAEDLVINGGLTTPEEGDTIEKNYEGVVTTYSLTGPWDGSLFWQYVDGHETGPEARIRVNGRLKSVE